MVSPRVTRVARVALVGCALVPSVQAASTDDCLNAYEEAQRFRKTDDLRAAQEQLEICDATSCPEVLRADCTRWLGEVRAAIPSFRVRAEHAGAPVPIVTLAVDGTALPVTSDPIESDPGHHTVRVEAAGYLPAETTVDLVAGQKDQSLVLALEPIPTSPERTSPTTRRIFAYSLLGTAVAGAGLFTGFGLASHAARNDLEDCRGSCPEAEVAPVRRKQVVADVSLVVALVTGGGGGYLLATKPAPRGSDARRPRFTLELGTTPRATFTHHF